MRFSSPRAWLTPAVVSAAALAAIVPGAVRAADDPTFSQTQALKCTSTGPGGNPAVSSYDATVTVAGELPAAVHPGEAFALHNVQVVLSVKGDGLIRPAVVDPNAADTIYGALQMTLGATGLTSGNPQSTVYPPPAAYRVGGAFVTPAAYAEFADLVPAADGSVSLGPISLSMRASVYKGGGGFPPTPVPIPAGGTASTEPFPGSNQSGPFGLACLPAPGAPAFASIPITTRAIPTLTSISPSTIPTFGGTSLTIKGTNLTGATEVNIGGKLATNVAVVDDSTVTATSPAGLVPGTADVAVVVGDTAATGAVTVVGFAPPSLITSISPRVAPVFFGALHVLRGSNLSRVTGVRVGTKTVRPIVFNATALAFWSPPEPRGTYPVVLVSAAGTSGVSKLTYR